MGRTEAVTYLCPDSHDNDENTISESGLGAGAPSYPNATLAPAGGGGAGPSAVSLEGCLLFLSM